MVGATFTVSLTAKGPLLTQSSTIGGVGLSAVMARSQGHYYLSGTLIKGLIGEAWQEFGWTDSREKWLGQESIKDSDDSPVRGCLFFEDLRDLATSLDQAGEQYRIEIDPERRSVDQGKMLVMESPYRPGQAVNFTGAIRLLAANEGEAHTLRRRVEKAFQWIAAVGSERTIGFGRVTSVECGEVEVHSWRGSIAPSNQSSYDLELTFEQPICFSRRRISDNLFESEDWIAGAALKGAVANLTGRDSTRWRTLQHHLSSVRFTHAFPALQDQGRPEKSRLSLVKYQDDGPILDVLDKRDAQANALDTPAFQIDWKTGRDPGWPKLKTELRVRSAIDGAKRRAEDEKLFAYKMLIPKGVRWLGRVDLSNVPEADRSSVAGELRDVLRHGLFALGKTKAHANVVVRDTGKQTRTAIATRASASCTSGGGRSSTWCCGRSTRRARRCSWIGRARRFRYTTGTPVSHGRLRYSWPPWEPVPTPGPRPRAINRWNRGCARTCMRSSTSAAFRRSRFRTTRRPA